MPFITEALPAVDTWRNRAACRFEDPESWFPLPTQDATEAVDVCLDCPVRKDCATAANERGESAGIWGGFRLPGERDEMREYLGVATRECERCGSTIANGNRITICYECTAATRSDRVDAAPAQSHILHLRAQECTYPEMAAASGVCESTLKRIASGRTSSASPRTIERVLSLAVDNVRQAVSA